MITMLFWLSFALVLYAYAGYPLLLFLCVPLFRRQVPILKKPGTPSVSIVIAARNEQALLPVKLENLRALEYPRSLIQWIVVSDGSTDGTAGILERAKPEVLPIILPNPAGKACALNEAVKYANGEILVFLDVRQSLNPNAVSALVRCFADPTIGAVSGELILESAAGSGANTLGMYWAIEKTVRRLESSVGSAVGVTGAIYAIRRELYTEMPAGTILDDLFIPMHVVRAGKRVVFEPGAIARDRISSDAALEFRRKVRTLTGNYQLLRLAPWLLTPSNPLLFRFISHKLLRLMVPFLLVIMLMSAGFSQGRFYRAFFWIQILFYTAALVGSVLPTARRLKPVALAVTFTMLNVAAAVAFCNCLRRRDDVWR